MCQFVDDAGWGLKSKGKGGGGEKNNSIGYLLKAIITSIRRKEKRLSNTVGNREGLST